MNRKIELLLQVTSDFRDFCESDATLDALCCPNDELSESDLDLISAAAKIPMHTNISLPDKD